MIRKFIILSLINLLATYFLPQCLFAAEADLIKAAQDACSGFSSTNAQSDRSTIKFDKYDLKIEGGNTLRIEENGVLLRKVGNFSFAEYASCMRDLINAIRDLSGQPGRQSDRLLLKQKNVLVTDEQLREMIPGLENGRDGEDKHIIFATFELHLSRAMMADKPVTNSLEDPSKWSDDFSNDAPDRLPRVWASSRERLKSGLRWAVALEFNGKPPADVEALVLSVGGKQWPVRIEEMKWEGRTYKYDSEEPWFLATTEIHADIEMADWPVVRSARFIDTTRSNLAVLEVDLHNMSLSDLAINELYVIASHPNSDANLPPRERTSCLKGDREETLVLNWNTIAAKSGSNAALTRGGISVKVPVLMRKKGACSEYSFLAAVPVSTSVEKQSLRKMSIQIKDIPPLRGAGGFPTRLEEWQKVRVGFRTSGVRFFPRAIDVSTRQHGDLADERLDGLIRTKVEQLFGPLNNRVQ